jgi:outer membrane protein assembly factor BamB
VASDGIVRTLNLINGDAVAPAARLLPPNSSGSGLIEADDAVYAVTSNGCGGAPDAVWAMDWSRDEKPVVSWKSNGAPVAGPALGTDGTVYVATGDGASAYANSAVALEAKTLRMKDWFTIPGGTGGSPRASSHAETPVVFSEGARNYVAIAGLDGRLYLLDAAALGGADHKTALVTGPAQAQSAMDGLSTWRDSHGVRWILSAAHAAAETGAIVAFKMTQGNPPALEQAWKSRELISPRSAMIVNGVVFALSGGTRSAPAVLYALNPDTGKEIWNSGNTITSFATADLSAGTGQVYVVTHDNTVWAFGIPQAY